MRFSVTITPSVPTTALEYLRLLDELNNGFLVQVPLNELRYDQTNVSPPKYDYHLEAFDGREWIQKVEYLGGFSSAPSLSLPTNGNLERWTESELLAHDALQHAIVLLTQKFGITNVLVEWLP